jgi:hypothetical protein
MAFKEGDEKPANSGRKKGVQNKVSRTVKETVLAVFNELQDDPKANLLEWGKKNPGYFYTIAAKLIPTELNAQVESNTIAFNVGFKKPENEES